jgi:hypothetical protein
MFSMHPGGVMTTAKDIAERLSLSVSAVGRGLADDRRISAETKFRVRQAAGNPATSATAPRA